MVVLKELPCRQNGFEMVSVLLLETMMWADLPRGDEKVISTSMSGRLRHRDCRAPKKSVAVAVAAFVSGLVVVSF